MSRKIQEWSLEKPDRRWAYSRATWKKEDLSSEKEDICTVIRPQHVLFVADLVSNGCCLSILPACTLSFFSFSFPFVPGCTPETLWGPSMAPSPRRTKESLSIIYRNENVCYVPSVGKGSFTQEHGERHTYSSFYLDLAHPGSVFIRSSCISDSMIPRWSRKRRLISLLSPASKQPARWSLIIHRALHVLRRSGKFTGYLDAVDGSIEKHHEPRSSTASVSVYLDAAKTTERDKQSVETRTPSFEADQKAFGRKRDSSLAVKGTFLPALERGRWT